MRIFLKRKTVDECFQDLKEKIPELKDDNIRMTISKMLIEEKKLDQDILDYLQENDPTF